MVGSGLSWPHIPPPHAQRLWGAACPPATGEQPSPPQAPEEQPDSSRPMEIAKMCVSALHIWGPQLSHTVGSGPPALELRPHGLPLVEMEQGSGPGGGGGCGRQHCLGREDVTRLLLPHRREPEGSAETTGDEHPTPAPGAWPPPSHPSLLWDHRAGRPRLASRGSSSQRSRNGSLSHHQVAPEPVVDDGRQQVHQKQASCKWKSHNQWGPPQTGGRVWKEQQHQEPGAGGGTQGPKGPKRAQQSQRCW